MHIFRNPVLRPNLRLKSGFEFIKDAIIIVDEKGKIVLIKPYSEGLAKKYKIDPKKIKFSSNVIMPGTVNTHCHIFQPPAISGELIKEIKKGKFVGWLPETLKFETKVKKNPELAREIAKAKFSSYIANGITASLEYTTSSEEAARIVLEVAREIGFYNRIKVGYVCMNQGVDFIDGVKLQTSDNEALKATERLLKNFGDRIVVIDRFPIAVSSPLRKKLAELARKYGVLYETHVDESEGEASIHASIYGGKRIMTTLFEDGVFEKGSKVGLAHALHTNKNEIKRIKVRIKVFIRACPNSNAQLQSHRLKDGTYVPFPLKEWEESGAIITFGLDNGAGRGLNIFSEALYERGRLHKNGYVPSYLELLKIATINGFKSFGFDPDKILREGEKADFIIVKPAGIGLFSDRLSDNLEELAGELIEGGQDSRNIETVFVEGRLLKNIK